MQIKQIILGEKIISNNIFIAPMAGFSDYAMRNLELQLGAGLVFTELVSAKGLFYGTQESANLLYVGRDETDENIKKLNLDRTVAQIFGSDPYYMRAACESEYLKDFDIIDINMGCPVPKVFKNGEGSALLCDIKRAENIIKECVKSGKIITIKIRTGLKYGDNVATDFAMMAENAGANLVSIHGRVREAYYSGEIDYDAIKMAKQSVKIPVIANGGIFNEQDASKMIEKTGADGIMIARGAVSDPFLVARLTDTKTNLNIREYCLLQLNKMVERYGERRAVMEFRKFIPYIIKGRENSKLIRKKIMQLERVEDLKQEIIQVL